MHVKLIKNLKLPNLVTFCFYKDKEQNLRMFDTIGNSCFPCGGGSMKFIQPPVKLKNSNGSRKTYVCVTEEAGCWRLASTQPHTYFVPLNENFLQFASAKPLWMLFLLSGALSLSGEVYHPLHLKSPPRRASPTCPPLAQLDSHHIFLKPVF